MDGKRLILSCGDGNCIEFTSVQLEGAKRMDASVFLPGRRLEVGHRLG